MKLSSVPKNSVFKAENWAYTSVRLPDGTLWGCCGMRVTDGWTTHDSDAGQCAVLALGLTDEEVKRVASMEEDNALEWCRDR